MPEKLTPDLPGSKPLNRSNVELRYRSKNANLPIATFLKRGLWSFPFAVCFLGDSGCGKSAVCARFMTLAPPRYLEKTIATEYSERRLTTKSGNLVKLMSWDTRKIESKYLIHHFSCFFSWRYFAFKCLSLQSNVCCGILL